MNLFVQRLAFLSHFSQNILTWDIDLLELHNRNVTQLDLDIDWLFLLRTKESVHFAIGIITTDSNVIHLMVGVSAELESCPSMRHHAGSQSSCAVELMFGKQDLRCHAFLWRSDIQPQETAPSSQNLLLIIKGKRWNSSFLCDKPRKLSHLTHSILVNFQPS